MLYLVRHANPLIDPSMAASQWQLSAVGMERARALAKYLERTGIQAVATSTEPKAYQTAQILAEQLSLQVETAAGLHEHERPLTLGPFSSQDEFHSKVKEFFTQPGQLVFGAETADKCFERFNRALLEVIARYHGKTLAVVSHGTVLSLLLSRYNNLDAYPVWKAMGMPTYIAVDLPDFKIYKTWTPPE
jgi:broad specificity phosphatase PhoE